MGVDQLYTLWGRGGKDPTVRDLLDDPLTKLLMDRDGVDSSDLLGLIATVETRLAVDKTRFQRRDREAGLHYRLHCQGATRGYPVK